MTTEEKEKLYMEFVELNSRYAAKQHIMTVLNAEIEQVQQDIRDIRRIYPEVHNHRLPKWLHVPK